MREFLTRLFKINLIIVFILVVFTSISFRVNAQVSETTCSKNGIPVPWYECLGGDDNDVVTANFPVSFYQQYYVENSADDQAYNLTVKRIVFDITFLFISIILLGVIIMIVLATIQRINAEDNEEKLKAAKKKINSTGYAIAILLGFLLLGQVISLASGVGNIWDVQIFR